MAPAPSKIVNEGLKQAPDDAFGLYQRGVIELFIQNQPEAAAQDFSRSTEMGEKYRILMTLVNVGAEAVGGEKADRRSYYAYAKPFLPIAYETILYLDIARLRSGQDGSDEVAKNLDSIGFALRRIGSLFPARLVGWPVPIIQFFLHKITLDQLMEQAQASSDKATSHVCVAHFFAGIFLDKDTEREEAQRHLAVAAESCPTGAIEKTLAKMELRRRGL